MKKHYLFVGSSLMGVVIVWQVVISALGPMKTAKIVSQYAVRDSLFMMRYDSSLDVEQWRPLYRKSLAQDALLKMADQKVIGLVVNIADSTTGLMINGVNIHQVKAADIIVDDFILKSNNLIFGRMFADPVLIDSFHTTIVKEPIVERQAPKTPEEALKNLYEPDTLIQNPAFIRFDLGYGAVLELVQTPIITPQEKAEADNFYREYASVIRKQKLDSLKKFSIPYYRPKIRMAMSNTDIRAIYRALPSDKMLVAIIQN